jgi:hypothetical protein
MSNHSEACNDSRKLCEYLFHCLAKNVPNLQRVETKSWCGFYSEGKKRFVNHRKNMERREIWCIGEPDELQNNSNLTIELRQPTTGGFGALFKAHFFVNNISEINDVCKLLSIISFKQT